MRLETAPTGPGENIELPNYFLNLIQFALHFSDNVLVLCQINYDKSLTARLRSACPDLSGRVRDLDSHIQARFAAVLWICQSTTSWGINNYLTVYLVAQQHFQG